MAAVFCVSQGETYQKIMRRLHQTIVASIVRLWREPAEALMSGVSPKLPLWN
jgi:hypothetical protein